MEHVHKVCVLAASLHVSSGIKLSAGPVIQFRNV